MKVRNPYNWIRWIARITGILWVAITLFIFIGEIIEGRQKYDRPALSSYTPIVLAIFVIWGIALGGLILALWKEGLGGIISLACFMLMYILNLFNREATMRGNAISIFLFFSIPSILYLIYWKLNSDDLKKTAIDKTENIDRE